MTKGGEQDVTRGIHAHRGQEERSDVGREGTGVGVRQSGTHRADEEALQDATRGLPTEKGQRADLS